MDASDKDNLILILLPFLIQIIAKVTPFFTHKFNTFLSHFPENFHIQKSQDYYQLNLNFNHFPLNQNQKRLSNIVDIVILVIFMINSIFSLQFP